MKLLYISANEIDLINKDQYGFKKTAGLAIRSALARAMDQGKFALMNQRTNKLLLPHNPYTATMVCAFESIRVRARPELKPTLQLLNET